MPTPGRPIALMPALDWLAVYLTDEPPYYRLDHLVGFLLLETTSKGTEGWEVIALDSCDYVDEASEMTDFYTTVHQADITDESRAAWSGEGESRLGITRRVG